MKIFFVTILNKIRDSPNFITKKDKNKWVYSALTVPSKVSLDMFPSGVLYI